MSRAVTFVVPGRLDARTGGSRYNRRMVDALIRRGWAVDVTEIDDTFPFPDQSTLQRTSDAFARIRSGTIVVVDGLAFGAIPDIAEREAGRLRLVALVHLPLAAGLGLDPAQMISVEGSERRALASAVLVVVTGTATLALMDAHRLPSRRLVVIEPGTDAAPLAAGSRCEDVHVLTVGALTTGKGHVMLLHALAEVPHRRWQLTCAGSLTRDRDTVARVRAALSRLGLTDRVSLAGELDEVELEACFHGADLFVLASLRETYGMAVAEALARGLPVVATRTGAIPALVGEDAGLVVPPGDGPALANALTRMLTDTALRARCGAGARTVRTRLATWDHAAVQFAAALESVDTYG